MAGLTVDKPTLDSNMATAIINLRNAYEKVLHINQWLVNNPVPAAPGVDPLLNAPFNYNANEAYAIRLVFQNLAADYNSAAQVSTFNTASQLTGLM